MYRTSSFVTLISLLYKMIRVIWKIPDKIHIVSKCLMLCLTHNFLRNLLCLCNILSGKVWLRGSLSWTASIHWYSPSRHRRIIVFTQSVSGWNSSLSLLNTRDTLDQGLLNILVLEGFFFGGGFIKTNKQKSLAGLISSWGWSRNTLRSWNFPFNLHGILWFMFCIHHPIHFVKVYLR